MTSTIVHAANYLQQLVLRHTFQDVSRSASTQGPLYLRVPIRGCEHNDASLRKLPLNCNERISTVRTRKAQVHECDIRLVAPELRHRLDRVRGLRDENHIGLRTDDCAETLAKYRVIFDTQDS